MPYMVETTSRKYSANVNARPLSGSVCAPHPSMGRVNVALTLIGRLFPLIDVIQYRAISEDGPPFVQVSAHRSLVVETDGPKRMHRVAVCK